MAIPTEDAPERFVPASLQNLPAPPSFMLRAGTWRDKNRYRHAIMSEGLVQHSRQQICDEVIRGIRAGWTGATADEIEAQIKEFWDAQEYHEKEATPDSPRFEHPFAEKASQLIETVAQGWPPLMRMAADNDRFSEECRYVVVSLYVCGWDGIDVPFGLEGGVVPLADVSAAAEALEKIEAEYRGKAIKGLGDAGTAFNELALACFQRLALGRSAEKNSDSPPPSSDDQSGSKTVGRAKGSGKSKASAPSTATPAT